MACHFQELKKVKSTRELLVDNLKNSEKVARLTDAVLWRTELAIVCFIHYLEELWDMIVFSSLNISL